MDSFLSFGMSLQIRAPTMYRDLDEGLRFAGLTQFATAGWGLVRTLLESFTASVFLSSSDYVLKLPMTLINLNTSTVAATGQSVAHTGIVHCQA